MPVVTIAKDGYYLLTIMIAPDPGVEFQAHLEVEMQGEHGYLSASDWPLLPVIIVLVSSVPWTHP